jgi:hypothetical protein
MYMQVTANPELRGVVARGASMLPTRTVERAFRPLYGQPLNFVAFGKAVKKLDDWYQQRGILGQVGVGWARWVWGQARWVWVGPGGCGLGTGGCGVGPGGCVLGQVGVG